MNDVGIIDLRAENFDPLCLHIRVFLKIRQRKGSESTTTKNPVVEFQTENKIHDIII